MKTRWQYFFLQTQFSRDQNASVVRIVQEHLLQALAMQATEGLGACFRGFDASLALKLVKKLLKPQSYAGYLFQALRRRSAATPVNSA